jgi:AcrR family transcriptional regulator
MKRTKDKEKRVFDIITAAVILFLKDGYEGTSMNAIADMAGISKGGLYHHFRNKEQVLIAANNRFMEPVQDLMKVALDGYDPLEALKKFIRQYLEHWNNHRDQLVFTFLTFSRIVANHRLQGYMEQYAKEMEMFYEFFLKKAVAQGSLEPHHTRAKAIALMSALDGSLIYIITNRDMTPETTANYFEREFFTDIETHEVRTGI